MCRNGARDYASSARTFPPVMTRYEYRNNLRERSRRGSRKIFTRKYSKLENHEIILRLGSGVGSPANMITYRPGGRTHCTGNWRLCAPKLFWRLFFWGNSDVFLLKNKFGGSLGLQTMMEIISRDKIS